MCNRWNPEVLNSTERSALSLEGCQERGILLSQPKACAAGPQLTMSQGDHLMSHGEA